MATSKGQRIGIWVIAVFMAVGTIGSFAIIVLANSNSQKDQARVLELQAKYQADTQAQSEELSKKYYDTLSGYASRAAVFGENVTELAKEDLVVGDGEDITSSSTFTAYYIGWAPNGTIFDSSLNEGSLKAPFQVTPGGVIEGWTSGVDGMKVGGIRELTIPSEQAYGESGQGDSIPPNTPLKFVVFIIPTPKTIEMPAELTRYYETGRLQ